MHRRKFFRNTAILTGGSLLFQKSALAELFRTYEFKFKMLRKDVGIFTERGGSIGFLLNKEGTVVIDAQFPDTAAHFIDEARKKNPVAFRYLLNTHHHQDHSSGNIAFKGIIEHVVAHDNSLVNQRTVAEKNKNLDKQLLPDMTFSKKWVLKLGGEKLKGYYFGPGHTNGDAVYHFENANIMHTGDLMFNKRHPFIDRSAGASIEHWIKDLDKIMDKTENDTIIIFGHSLNPGEETGSRDDVRKFKDYLSRLLDFANTEFKKGVTKEAFIKNTSIPGVTEWSGQGIERPLTAAYEEVEAKTKKA